MKVEPKKGYIALMIVSIVWGTNYFAVKVGTMHMPGLFITGLRQFTSGVMMAGFFVLKGNPIPSWTELKKIATQGIILLCIANGLLTWSMEYISSGLAAIIVALVPLFIALFSVILVRKTRITKKMLLGLLAGFAGVVSIFYDYEGFSPGPSLTIGFTMAIASTIIWSFGTVYSSGHQTPTDILFIAGIQMLVAGAVMLLICLATGKYVNLTEAAPASWYALAYLIVFGSLIGYSAYVFALRKLPPALVTVYAYINPVVALFCGWLLLKEKLTLHMLTGSAIILLAIIIVNREFKKLQA
jgi:drug/metabolite transporter (DMT)-like permease